MNFLYDTPVLNKMYVTLSLVIKLCRPSQSGDTAIICRGVCKGWAKRSRINNDMIIKTERDKPLMILEIYHKNMADCHLQTQKIYHVLPTSSLCAGYSASKALRRNRGLCPLMLYDCG